MKIKNKSILKDNTITISKEYIIQQQLRNSRNIFLSTPSHIIYKDQKRDKKLKRLEGKNIVKNYNDDGS